MGKMLWAGALTLGLLVLPIVVIATQEALAGRADARSARRPWRWGRPAGR